MCYGWQILDLQLCTKHQAGIPLEYTSVELINQLEIDTSRMEYILVKFSDRYVYIACNSEETTDIQKFCEKGKTIRQHELYVRSSIKVVHDFWFHVMSV